MRATASLPLAGSAGLALAPRALMSSQGSGFPVRHTLFSPVHILGHSRSGTSLLAAMCRHYFGIAFGTESQFLVRYARCLASYGDLTIDDNFRRLVHDITSERFFRRNQKFGWRVDPAAVFNRSLDRSLRGLLDAAFSQLAAHLGMERWGDKTPEYVYDLAVIRGLLPDAQFIHVVRDGRDVALSSLREPVFGAKNVHKAAREWSHELALVNSFAASLPRRQFLEIRYEDLLDDPESVCDVLIGFLAIDDRDGSLRTFVRSQIGRHVDRSNTRKWRVGLSDAERRRFEDIAGQWLQRYGYEMAVAGARCPGRIETLYWDVDNQVRKWTRIAHWKDNFYKVTLRAQALLRTVSPARMSRARPSGTTYQAARLR